jgi:squalene synthase HpnC
VLGEGVRMDEPDLRHPIDVAAELSVLDDVASRSSAQMGAENFPVALRLLPRQPRTRLGRVYAFARFVDDVGDEAAGDRTVLLDIVDRDVRRLATGEASLAVVKALAPVVDECAVPIDYFLQLIEANRLDQRTFRYATFEDLLDYCRLSATPIGRIVLHVANAATDKNMADSDSVCSALQVLEHCQDVAEDARAGRIYLPETELRAAGVTDADLVSDGTSDRLRGVIGRQVERATRLLQPGRELVSGLSGWSRLAVAGYVAGGLGTAAALRRADYDVLSHHVATTKMRTAGHAARLMVGR